MAIILAVVIGTIAALPPFQSRGQSTNAPLATNSPEAARVTVSPISIVYTKALAGDVREALRVLETVPVETLNSKERIARENLLQVFTRKQLPPIEVQDPFVAQLVGIYQDYWMRVLLREATPPEGEAYLFKRLSLLLEQAGCHTQFRSLGALLEELKKRLRRQGFYSTLGITQPYWDLIVWRSETNRTYKIKLPESTERVKVVFMADFVTLGWEPFATCGKASPGGWARNDALYCVAAAYDTQSKSFEVSYLAHEAQHFADYRHFPKLEQPELEYRAKLVELILNGENARAVLAGIAAQTGSSRSAPHNYANLRVITDISHGIFGGDIPVCDPARWRQIPDQAISGVAKGLLERNTRNLQAYGARRVSRILEDPMPPP